MAPKTKSSSSSSSESSCSSSEQDDKLQYESKPTVRRAESAPSEDEESGEGKEESEEEGDNEEDSESEGEKAKPPTKAHSSSKIKDDEESESEGEKAKPPTKARSSTTRSSFKDKDKGNSGNLPTSYSAKPGSKPTDSPKSRPTKPPPSKRSEPTKSGQDDHKKRKLSEVNPEGGGRHLVHRIWNVAEEIDLLKGFLDYSKKYPNGLQDHAAIYEFVQKSLNSDGNKSQTQYQNNLGREEAGKDVTFRTPEEQEAYEISKKIWADLKTREDAEFEENNSQNPVSHTKMRHNSKAKAVKKENVQNHVEGCKVPELMDLDLRLVSEWVHPGFMLEFGGLGFVGGQGLAKRVLGSMDKSKLKTLEEKWRKQQMLEMDAYLKRVELVHEQTKLMVETLESMGS
ncbi:hypothetical protein AMTRI_Chr07g78860 [Amborella trichopoda]